MVPPCRTRVLIAYSYIYDRSALIPLKGIVCRKQKFSYQRYPKSMPRSILCRYSSTNGDRNTYPCRPKAGITFPHKRCRCRLTKPTSRSCRGSRPPSATSATPRRASHTYGGDDGLRSSSPGRAAEDLDRNTSSAAAGYG